MKLTKRDKDLIEALYNDNMPFKVLTNLNHINSAFKLSELFPDRFITQRLGYREVSFTIKDLGYIPQFLKEV